MEHDLKSLVIEVLNDEHVSVSYDGTLVAMPLIDYNSLKKKSDSAVEDLNKIMERRDEATDLVTDLARYTTYSWYRKHEGAKKGCGRLADAMIIANAVRGMSLAEIQAKRYPYKKGSSKKYGRDKIFDALSVKKPDDLQRIQSLMEDFPEVFSGIDREQVYKWMQKRASKGGKKS